MRALAITLALLLALAGGGYFWLRQNSLQLAIPKSQVQERIDARLPFNGARGPLQYAVTRAAVDLRPDGRLAIDADITARALGADIGAELLGSGVLSYREGEFFLGDVAVEEVTLATGPPRQGGSRLRQAIDARARAALSASSAMIRLSSTSRMRLPFICAPSSQGDDQDEPS